MKKFILGLVCGTLIASTVVFAASYVAEDASFKVFVNGKEFTSFSRNGLIEQLEFEGFTKEQAEYGVTAVGY